MRPDGVRRLFRLLRGRRDAESEVDAELAHHFASAEADLIARGMGPAEAHSEALRRFGEPARVRSELIAISQRRELRRTRRDRGLDVWLDARQAARSLARTPGVTTAIVVMLALGIGANAAMYGILDRLFLSAPPHIADPGGIVRFWTRETNPVSGQVTYDASDVTRFAAFAHDLRGIAGIAGYTSPDREYFGSGQAAEEARVSVVTGGFFSLLGVPAKLGRVLTSADDSAGAPPAAVIGHGYWKRRFGGAPGALGATLRLHDVTYTIVGVAPEGFPGPDADAADLWLPVEIAGPAGYSGPNWRELRYGGVLLTVVARLRRGVSQAAAAEEATAVLRHSLAGQPYADPDSRILVGPLLRTRGPEGIGRGPRLPLVVGGVAAIVLLIACANVANLLLLRAAGRRRELAVRRALGAGTWRVTRLLVLESLVLAAVAGAAAGGVASVAGRVLRATLLPRYQWADAGADARVWLFATLTALAIGVLTGLVPAWTSGRSDAAGDLRVGTHAARRARRPLRAGLLVLQAGLSLTLIVGAALFSRSFQAAKGVDLGFDLERLATVRVDPADRRSQASVPEAALSDLVERARHLPGVTDVALSTNTLMWGQTMIALRVPGLDSMPRGQGFFLNGVSPNYFRVVGLDIQAGRGFTDLDGRAAPRVAVVNARMARVLWPGQDPIGRCLIVGMNTTECTAVVGVVEEAREHGSRPDPLAQYYVPMAQEPYGGTQRALVVRTAGNPSRLTEPLLGELAVVFPDLPRDRVRSLPVLFARELRTWRVGAGLFGVAAGLALLLAAVGLYGVVAFGVRQRERELGIRRALGARASDLVRLVLADSVAFALAGIALGTGAALWGVRFVAPLLFEGRNAREPLVFVLGALVLLAAALAAGIGPALGAARVDPRVALQAE